jgi:hypothetical protein
LLKIADQAVAGLSHSSTPAAHKAAH